MRFRKITFSNYRCFLNGEISFREHDDQNITLLVGPNGGGKTETLFAFWWVLYDFDFSKLRGKETTPYALNAALYRKLVASQKDTSEACFVSLEFEYENTVYCLTRKTEYRKSTKQIKEYNYLTLSHYGENGELSLPIRDSEIINKQLARMIPENILNGIIFDGERMQKLSATDDNSKAAIKGVINDITNVELVEKCKGYFSSIKNDINKELRNAAKKAGDQDMTTLVNQIEEHESEISELRNTISNWNNELEQRKARNVQISEELQKNKLVCEIENKRNIERDNLHKLETQLEIYYKDFNATLKNGYLMISDPLLDAVDSIIQKYDVPQDLTTLAVKSILARNNCICGRCLDEKSKKVLTELIAALPPDNINSTLSEMVRQIRDRQADYRNATKSAYKYVDNCENDIKNCKDNIAHYSAEISGLESDAEEKSHIIELEKENQSNEKRIAVLEHELPKCDEQLKLLEHELTNLKSQREAKTRYTDTERTLNIELTFIDKCLKALERIKDINKDTALTTINIKLDNAYKLLSEDAALGRRIRIIQYDDSRRYQLVVYLEKSCNKLIEEWKSNGSYSSMFEAGVSEDEIFEKAILRNIDPNSTGQSKMNTLAFVKAILDYSNLDKDEDGIGIKKTYPLLIDAPFGDIAGENLTRSAEMLYSFTNQVILMLDNDRFQSLHKQLAPHVCLAYNFVKNDNKNYSTIIARDEV